MKPGHWPCRQCGHCRAPNAALVKGGKCAVCFSEDWDAGWYSDWLEIVDKWLDLHWEWDGKPLGRAHVTWKQAAFQRAAEWENPTPDVIAYT